MREIKFRIWDSKNKKMLDDRNIAVGINGMLWLKEDYDYYHFTDDFATYKIMQYTGLKDKNGKEIYDRDIIKNNGDWVYTVYWHKSAGAWDTKPIDRERVFTTTKPLFEQVEEWECEVIGNIYENPELLKEER